MTLEEIELHDALLKSMVVDYAAKSVTIGVDYYESNDVRERKPALIIFDGVESISQVSNLIALEKNTFAGTHNTLKQRRLAIFDTFVRIMFGPERQAGLRTHPDPPQRRQTARQRNREDCSVIECTCNSQSLLTSRQGHVVSLLTLVVDVRSRRK
jgi:hypothetical protein